MHAFSLHILLNNVLASPLRFVHPDMLYAFLGFVPQVNIGSNVGHSYIKPFYLGTA